MNYKEDRDPVLLVLASSTFGLVCFYIFRHLLQYCVFPEPRLVFSGYACMLYVMVCLPQREPKLKFFMQGGYVDSEWLRSHALIGNIDIQCHALTHPLQNLLLFIIGLF